MAESRSDMASEKMKQFALFCILSPNVIAISVIRLPSTEINSIARKTIRHLSQGWEKVGEILGNFIGPLRSGRFWTRVTSLLRTALNRFLLNYSGMLPNDSIIMLSKIKFTHSLNLDLLERKTDNFQWQIDLPRRMTVAMMRTGRSTGTLIWLSRWETFWHSGVVFIFAHIF